MEIPGANATSQLLDQAVSGADDARVRALGAEAHGNESREGLEKTAREFEAVFMNTLMKAMRKTVPDNKLFNSGGATKFYRQMHDAEMSKALANGQGGMGIADLIIDQFSRNIAEKKSGVAEGSPTIAPQGLNSAPSTSPVHREVMGPPAPDAMARYRSMSPVGKQVAEMARLRGAAATQEPAVADTLKRFEFEIGSAAVGSGLDPGLILAMVMEESGGDPSARSPKGALGLMQLMPGTAAEVGVTDASSPAQNLRGGSDYMAQMMRKYDDQLDLALAAYNAGPGNVDRAGRQIPEFKETQRYVRRVIERYQGLGGTNLAIPDRTDFEHATQGKGQMSTMNGHNGTMAVDCQHLASLMDIEENHYRRLLRLAWRQNSYMKRQDVDRLDANAADWAIHLPVADQARIARERHVTILAGEVGINIPPGGISDLLAYTDPDTKRQVQSSLGRLRSTAGHLARQNELNRNLAEFCLDLAEEESEIFKKCVLKNPTGCYGDDAKATGRGPGGFLVKQA